MYADDISLIAKSLHVCRPCWTYIACEYARKWRYQLNSVNSLVMVMGESAVTRLRERLRRVWKLGNSIVCETDEQHHLGILRSSTVHRTNKRATAARSAFFALNVVGSRFGSLHLFTSLKLYRAICLPILLYGCEVWACSKTELLFLKRVHRKNPLHHSRPTHQMPLLVSYHPDWDSVHSKMWSDKECWVLWSPPFVFLQNHWHIGFCR